MPRDGSVLVFFKERFTIISSGGPFLITNHLSELGYSQAI